MNVLYSILIVIASMSNAYLHWEVPCQIDIRFVLVHPNLCHPKCIASSVKGDVTVVGLFRSSNMGHSGTRQNLHASPTQPNLGFENAHTPIKLQFWYNVRRKKVKIKAVCTERREAKLRMLYFSAGMWVAY